MLAGRQLAGRLAGPQLQRAFAIASAVVAVALLVRALV
jgi:hypothetical protein